MPETWLASVAEHGHGMSESEVTSTSEQADELLLMGLRLREGSRSGRWQAFVRPPA
jgi:coproporphyrinogen III oxidase-like Fe-S oxidoreductase